MDSVKDLDPSLLLKVLDKKGSMTSGALLHRSPSMRSSSSSSAMWPSILMMSGCEANAASSCFLGARTFLANLVASFVCNIYIAYWYIDEGVAGKGIKKR